MNSQKMPLFLAEDNIRALLSTSLAELQPLEIDELLGISVQKGFSDLHLLPEYPVTLRIDGRLTPLADWSKVTPEMTASLFTAITSDAQKRIFNQALELDFSYEVPGLSRFRVNASLQKGSIGLVFRRIPIEIPTIEELGLPAICQELAQRSKGLILVTGPAGSGKSSTLAAMLRYLNENHEKKIITIEDPVEFLHPMGKCLISQRELGTDTKSFAEAVRHALRQDPDVLMMGEMRDLETIAAAITAAETGHLVLSTLHTGGTVESVSRIIDVFPASQQSQVRTQLSEIIEGVISQLLLRRASGRGRVAAFEVMVGTTAVKSLIRTNRTHEIVSFLETGRRFGMRTLEQDVERLLADGLITQEEASTRIQGISHIEIRSF